MGCLPSKRTIIKIRPKAYQDTKQTRKEFEHIHETFANRIMSDKIIDALKELEASYLQTEGKLSEHINRIYSDNHSLFIDSDLQMNDFKAYVHDKLSEKFLMYSTDAHSDSHIRDFEVYTIISKLLTMAGFQPEDLVSVTNELKRIEKEFPRKQRGVLLVLNQSLVERIRNLGYALFRCLSFLDRCEIAVIVLTPFSLSDKALIREINYWISEARDLISIMVIVHPIVSEPNDHSHFPERFSLDAHMLSSLLDVITSIKSLKSIRCLTLTISKYYLIALPPEICTVIADILNESNLLGLYLGGFTLGGKSVSHLTSLISKSGLKFMAWDFRVSEERNVEEVLQIGLNRNISLLVLGGLFVFDFNLGTKEVEWLVSGFRERTVLVCSGVVFVDLLGGMLCGGFDGVRKGIKSFRIMRG